MTKPMDCQEWDEFVDEVRKYGPTQDAHMTLPVRTLHAIVGEVERLREELATTQQEKFLTKGKLMAARHAARECWRVIYESGTHPISDEDCAALSEDRPWLERKNGENHD